MGKLVDDARASSEIKRINERLKDLARNFGTDSKIYKKNDKKENMIDYLKEMLEIEKTVTFGSIPGRYDEYIMPGDTNQMVRSLKKRYEPVKNPWKRT